jgi:FKBP-type peptidyl-prolyl cis-trans isomerase 2
VATTKGARVNATEVADTIEEARKELAAGHEKQAARLLTDAAYGTHDPGLEQRIRELALQGREKAGWFGKGRWDEIIRIADLRRNGVQN